MTDLSKSPLAGFLRDPGSQHHCNETTDALFTWSEDGYPEGLSDLGRATLAALELPELPAIGEPEIETSPICGERTATWKLLGEGSVSLTEEFCEDGVDEWWGFSLMLDGWTSDGNDAMAAIKAAMTLREQWRAERERK